MAESVLAKMPDSWVLFKYSCEKCGERCTLDQPNMLYENGECHKCGHIQSIDKAGFTLVSKLG